MPKRSLRGAALPTCGGNTIRYVLPPEGGVGPINRRVFIDGRADIQVAATWLHAEIGKSK